MFRSTAELGESLAAGPSCDGSNCVLSRPPGAARDTKEMTVRSGFRQILALQWLARRAMRRGALWIALALVFGLVSPALAELTHRVVLLNPLAPDETTLEAITRVRGELSAAGFDVVAVPHRGGADPREELESAARDVGALAAFAIVRADSGDAAEIVVLDRLRGKVLNQRMAFDRLRPRRAAAVLAVGAVELLKASLAEFWLSPAQPPVSRVETPPPVVREAPPSPPPAPPPRIGVEAGVAVLSDLGEMGTVASPLLKVSYRFARYWMARVAVSSVGITSRVDGSLGSAFTNQELGTVDLVVLWPDNSALRGLASAGVGAYHLGVQGIGSEAVRGLTGNSWSLALAPGLGGQAELSAHIAFTVEAQVLFALPPPIVRLGTQEFGPAGDPSLVISAGITGNF
jgi:hypothetical protein